MKLRRVFVLARTEVLHVVRDHATLAQVLIVPIVQLLILSNAATFQIRNTPTYVVDLDRSSASRGLVNRLAASGHFQLAGDRPSLASADAAMLSGDATLAVIIPHDFESSLVRTGRSEIELSVNAEKGSAAGIVLGYAQAILAEWSRSVRIQPDRLRPTSPAITVRTRNRYNAELNYKHYMVPGILVALVTIIGTLLTSQNIAREKELGTLEQLNVTPITRGEFIAGKLLPFWMLAMLELTLGLTVGRLVFDIPMRGSLLLLFASAGVYLLVALGIGLWISTVVDTQQQAMFVTFFIIIVYLLMSGLWTPIDSMAPWVQTASQINPTRHFVTISRAILVKGANLSEIAQPLALLGGFAVVALGFAVSRYRKRVG